MGGPDSHISSMYTVPSIEPHARCAPPSWKVRQRSESAATCSESDGSIRVGVERWGMEVAVGWGGATCSESDGSICLLSRSHTSRKPLERAVTKTPGRVGDHLASST